MFQSKGYHLVNYKNIGKKGFVIHVMNVCPGHNCKSKFFMLVHEDDNGEDNSPLPRESTSDATDTTFFQHLNNNFWIIHISPHHI